MEEQKTVRILLVEDDPGHAVLIQRNLRRGGVTGGITVMDNGQKAVDFLLTKRVYADNDLAGTDLIILDLNLPVMDGYQVLKIIKNDERTKHIPIVVLTTTDNTHEVTRCYDLGCNAYLTKPVNYDQFSAAIQNLGLFLTILQIPHRE